MSLAFNWGDMSREQDLHCMKIGPAGRGRGRHSAPSRAVESGCLERREGGKGEHGRFARHHSSWELLERRHMARVGRLTS